MKSKNVFSVFTNTRALVFCAFLAAFSAVIGKFLSVNIGDSIRFSVENLTIILAGYMFGPVAGGMVGVIADLLGCLIKGFAINPLITLCSMFVGVIAGLVSLFFAIFQNREKETGKAALAVRVYVTTFAAHIIGNMMLKSLALWYSYGTPFETLILRVPIYTVNAIVEGTAIFLIMQSRAFTDLIYNDR